VEKHQQMSQKEPKVVRPYIVPADTLAKDP